MIAPCRLERMKRNLSSWARRSLLVTSLFMALSSSPAAEVSGKRAYDVPSGDAKVTLRLFAEQSGQEIIYPAESVAGVKTNALKGEYTPREAIDRLVAGTALVVTTAKTGAIAVNRSGSPAAQQARPVKNGAPVNDNGDGGPTRPDASPNGDETIVLSPFTVNASDDWGYLATGTLAGSRIKTPLSDVAAQISVFTPELMNDLGLTNLDEVYLYSTNVESYLQFTPGGDRGAAFGSLLLRDNNRIRGLGSATNLRSFFPTGFGIDTYNTDRITIASGPNAILFGLGNPGGITDASLKRANFRNHTTLTYRRDNFNGYRGTFDTNLVLLPKKAALRIGGLDADNRTFRKHDKDENRRLYAALTLRPFAKTTVRLHGEWVQRNASRAAMILPYDYLTPWLDNGRPEFNNAGLTPASAGAAVTNRITGGALQSVFQRAGGTGYVLMAGNTPANQPVANWGNTAVIRGAHTNAATLQDRAIAWSLLRPDVFDPDANLYGDAYENRERGRIFNVFAEQEITKNFFVEAAYMREVYRNRRGSFANSPNLDIFADANRFLSDGVTPNPNLGKLYSQAIPTGARGLEDREESRLTMSYELDFTKRAGLARWFGRNRLAAMYNYSDSSNRSQNVRALISGRPSFLPVNGQNNLGDPSRPLQVRTYLGNGIDHSSPVAGGPLDFNEPLRLTGPGGEQFEVRMWNNPDGAVGAATGTVQNVISRVLAGQSYLLKDRLIASYGWRESRVRMKNALDLASTTRLPYLQTNGTTTNAGLFPVIENTHFGDNWDSYDNGQSVNWGLVARPLPWLSFHYSDSENFAIQQASSFDPFGHPIPGSNGEGKDYGFSINRAEGKLALRINRYVNGQANIRPDNIITALRTVPIQIETRILEVAPSTPKQGIDLERFTTNNYQVSNTSEARGYDIELIANPTANWRAFVSIGRQRTVTQIDDTWWRWVEQRLPVWQTFGRGWDLETRAAGNVETIHQAYDGWVATQRDPLVATSGRFVDNQREWRVNGVLTYVLTAGRLRGASIGLGGRWRSAANIGYPLKTLPSGQEVFDLEHPFKGTSEFYADAFAAYSLRKLSFLHLKTDCKVQINVRNLLNERGYVATDMKTDGSPKIYTYQTPRQVILSVTIEL